MFKPLAVHFSTVIRTILPNMVEVISELSTKKPLYVDIVLFLNLDSTRTFLFLILGVHDNRTMSQKFT